MSVSFESPIIFPSSSDSVEDDPLPLEDVPSTLLTKEIPDPLSVKDKEGSMMLDHSSVNSVIPVKEEPGGTLSVSLNVNPTQLIDHSLSPERIQVYIFFLVYCLITVLIVIW